MTTRKSGKRTKSGRLSRAGKPLFQTTEPNDRVIERRNLFSFVHPSKGPDGRHGTIDQDICDGIGQLHALGLLDGHGLDPQDMRDAAREYARMYWKRFPDGAPRTGKMERGSRDTSNEARGLEPREDAKFCRMDEALQGYERSVLMTLVVDTAWGDEIVPWAQSLIDEALMERKRFRKGVIRFPDENDRAMFEACIRGLCLLVDGGMEMRRAA